MYNVHSLCKNTGTDFSQFLLAAAKLYFCWIVVFPRRKHPPERQMCVLPTPHTRPATSADFRFGGGLGPLSGLEMHRCTRLRLVGARSRPKCSTIRSETAQSVQRDSQKLAFRPLWATLLEQIGEGAVFEKNILFTMFSSHRATPGLSTIAPLTSLETECGPEPAFLCPLAPTGAPKRRRRSP